MDEMYHGEFDIKGVKLNLDIQDTGGNYVDEFPAMLKCSLASADAVLLVYTYQLLEYQTCKEWGRVTLIL